MFAIAAALLMPLLGSALEEQQMPEVLYNSDPDVQSPVWVSATAAIDSSGVVNERLFSAGSRRTIEGLFAESTIGDCYIVEEAFESRVDPPNRDSVAGAVKHSSFIFLGHVAERAYGFHFYVPGTLLRIKPSQILHGEAILDSYFIFFPVGNFTAGPYSICKSDSGYPSLPDIGEELLVMVPAHRIRISTDPFLELEEASSVVVIPEVGPPDLPRVFKVSEGERSVAEEKSMPTLQTRDELVAAVKRSLRKGGLKP